MPGRPSNRDERRQQVMEAFVRIAARHGLDGATLSDIAEEAGLKRPLVRHHLGNRDEMVRALQGYVLEQFAERADQMLSALPAADPAHELVEILFSGDAESPPDLVLTFAEIASRAGEDEGLRSACADSVLEFEVRLVEVLQAGYPNASKDDARAAAHGVTALYFNATSMAPLRMPEGWHETARALAHSLCKDLGGKP